MAEALVEPPPPRVRSSPGAREMTAAEVLALCREVGWGVLSTVEDDGPYSVPVRFAFDGALAYFASGEGRKLANVLRDGRACITVTDVRDGDTWRCAVLRGTVARVTGRRECLTAAAALLRQGSGGSLSIADLRRAAAATWLRLTPREVSGRRRG